MFGATSFNQDISNWDVGNANNLSNMFTNNPDFNQNLSSWNVNSNANLQRMFKNAPSFDQVLNGYYWLTHVGNQYEIFNGSSGSFGTLPDPITITISTNDFDFDPYSVLSGDYSIFEGDWVLTDILAIIGEQGK